MSDLNLPYSMALRSISLSPPGTSIVYESIYLIGAFLFHPWYINCLWKYIFNSSLSNNFPSCFSLWKETSGYSSTVHLWGHITSPW